MAAMNCRGELNCCGVYGRGDCASCGFNPSEKERRLKEGHFVNIKVHHELHNDYGRVVHVANKICKNLVFKEANHV